MTNTNYLLTDCNDLTHVIRAPLSARIKYTSFDASKKYLVFGASSGSIYIFTLNDSKMERLSLLQIIPSKFGLINQVAISKQEKLISFSNAKGKIGFVEITAQSPQIVVAQIDECATVLHWLDDDKKLYLGDIKGNVWIVSLSYFMVRNNPTVAVHKILLLDTAVTQISSYEDYLLVSTYSKSVLCNTEKEEFKQIGNRPRDGNYGACFLTNSTSHQTPIKIFCARPGYRIWRVDGEGNVLHTAQLKTALTTASTNILDLKTDLSKSTKPNNPLLDDNNSNLSTTPNISVNSSSSSGSNNSSSYLAKQPQRQFTKLYKVCNDYLLTYNDTCFYIIDPTTNNILLWNDQFTNIECVQITDDNVLNVFTKTNNVYRLRVVPIEQHIFMQLHIGKYVEAAELIRQHLQYFEEKSPQFTEKERAALMRMRETLEEPEGENRQKLDELSVMLAQIKLNDHNGILTAASQMDNGIFILENNVYKATVASTIHKTGEGSDTDGGGGNSLLTNFDKNLKDALISVVRGSYSKNIQQLVSLQSAANGEHPAEIEKIIKRRNFNVEMNETPIISTKQMPNFLLDATITTNGVSEEEKHVRNLFLVYRSSQISNLNFLDRYATIFDEFDTPTIIRLLKALEVLLLKNGDEDPETAQKNCTKIYFDYLKAELIWELEDESRQYIKTGFMLLNTTSETSNSIRCQSCNFPVKSGKMGCYPEIGTVLLQYYWSRQTAEIWELVQTVPFLLQQLLKFYMQKTSEGHRKLILLAFNMGHHDLFVKAADFFSTDDWQIVFAYLQRILTDRTIQCFYCDKVNTVDDTFFCGTAEFYAWNFLLMIAVEFLDVHFLFNLLKEYSNVIPKEEISQKFYLKCLANA